MDRNFTSEWFSHFIVVFITSLRSKVLGETRRAWHYQFPYKTKDLQKQNKQLILILADKSWAHLKGEPNPQQTALLNGTTL